jgi:2-oxoglutarate ferredoxin oxidoreductase subunit beta
MAIKDYIRERFFPHIWCPGCGHGTVMSSLLRAIDSLGLSKNEIVMVSGIGCSSRISGYVDFHTLHTLHGRALAFATGVKMSLPELNLIVPMGDGDALAIGGNHFIHAARRNIDLTAIVMNNRIYGMTGGQYSTFVARSTTYHVQQLTKILKQAILHEGFSVVEVLTQCPTYFGRKNRAGSAVDMMESYQKNTTPIGSKAKKENPDLIERGIFVQEERPEYCSEYDKIIEKAMASLET